MADKVVGLKLGLDGDEANKTVGSFKQQLKQANEELVRMTLKFGETSDEAVQAAKNIAAMKDQLGDAKDLADAFSPDAKFNALSKSLVGVSGGFAALQGAMGLFGSESENVQKTLLKVQSAMAFSEGLNSVFSSIDAFKNLATVIKGNVIKAFGSLKAALISTGIGAAVVAVGLLISNFDKVKEVVLKFIPGLGKVADFIGGIIDKVTDFVGITDEAGRRIEKTVKDLEKNIKNGERFLDLNGDKYDQYTQRKIKADLDYQKTKKDLLKEEGLTENERTNLLRQAEEKRLREINKASQDRVDAINKANEETLKKQKELSEKQKAEEEKKKAERKAKLDKELKDQQDFDKDVLERMYDTAAKIRDADMEIAKDKEQAEADRKEKFEKFVGSKGNPIEAEMALKKAAAEEAVRNDEIEKQSKLDLYNTIGYGLGNLAGLFKQGSAAAKVAALADIAVGTATGFIQGLDIAQKGAKAGGPAAPFLFPIFYASQIAAVLGAAARAKNVLSSGSAGSSSTNVSVPQINTPTAPIRPQQSSTTLDQNSINAIGNAAASGVNRAYVLETDVTNNQQRVRQLNRMARLS